MRFGWSRDMVGHPGLYGRKEARSKGYIDTRDRRHHTGHGKAPAKGLIRPARARLRPGCWSGWRAMVQSSPKSENRPGLDRRFIDLQGTY